MSFGIPLTSCGSENMFGCTKPGFWNSSNDNTRPTTDCVFPLGAGCGGGAVDVGVLEVVGEAVVVWASVFVSCVVDVVGAVSVGVVSEFGTGVGVGAVTGEDWVVGADVAVG